ncbi:MAG: protein kinase [Gemmatimonadales bacterium]|nr:protein kinase [Gemmatimonadales bacterium]
MTAPSPDQSLVTRLSDALGQTYTIEGEIGRGGMGVVFRARDERLHRRVAIKVLPPDLAFQQEIRERFTREAQTAAKLAHPNIVPIHDVGEGNGLVYFVMGYVDGESVAGRIRRKGRVPPDEVRRIMSETADALSAASSMGIVHRDIKPDNILLDGPRGRVMVTDFGIAKALSSPSGSTLTGAGIAIGTPSYMSPEQAAGEREIDGRSDLYSLGIVTYHMLTGELPFQAPTVAGLLMKHITEAAPDVRDLRPDVPEDLALAVARCLEKDPANRWPTADALRRALETRSVGTYRPTGTSFRAQQRQASPRPGTGTARPRVTSERPGLSPRGGVSPRGSAGLERLERASGAPERPAPRGEAARRPGSRPARPETTDEVMRAPDTGEPAIVQKVRGQFATFAAVNLGLFLLNVATTQLSPPWFLFPFAGMSIGLFSNYAKLWQAGYSWRDVLRRPPAPDSIESRGRPAAPGSALPVPKAAEFGSQYPLVSQLHGDRQAILRLVERLPPDEQALLPELAPTADALYQRATDLGRTLAMLEADMRAGAREEIEAKLAALAREPAGDERARQLDLLERQQRSLAELEARRAQVKSQFESCVLAMQNLRLDLLKLKSANLREVMGDISQATQQAKALSRNVDNAIAAAAEVKEALRG